MSCYRNIVKKNCYNVACKIAHINNILTKEVFNGRTKAKRLGKKSNKSEKPEKLNNML